MGVAQGANFGDKIKQNRPRGAARGAAAGRFPCYLDNIEITQAKRETLLFSPSFTPSQKFLKKY